MPSRRRILLAALAALLVLVALVAWQHERLRRAWWDSLAAGGPDAETLSTLDDCEEPGWWGWASVASADLAMPCGEPLAAQQLALRLDASLRRDWLTDQLAREELPMRARWRITRALELSGAEVPTATVTLLLDGRLGEELATEIMLADGGARDPRERWVAARLRATRGEPLESLTWRDIVFASRLSGEPSEGVRALRAGLQVPVDVEPRLHALPEAWAYALAPALACDPTTDSCLEAWAGAAEVWERSPEGEGLPLDDDADGSAPNGDVGLLAPILAYEGASGAERIAVERLLSAQVEGLSLAWSRPWLGIGVGGTATSLSRALWTGRMGPWTQALWARELALRSDAEAEVRRSEGHLVVTLATSQRTLCGGGPVEGALRVVLDEEVVARALLELHGDAVAAASRLAGWTGPDHAVFGATGGQVPPPDPCSSGG